MNSECADAANIRCICMRCIGEKKCLPCRGIGRRVLMIIFWVGDVLPFFRPSVAIAIVLISFIFIRGVLTLRRDRYTRFIRGSRRTGQFKSHSASSLIF